MRFQWPWLLWLLLTVPAFAVAYAVMERARVKGAGRFASPAMQPNVAPHRPSWRRHVPPVLLLLAVASLLVGFARPERTLSVRRDRATIMLVLDGSKSMEATDIEPTRLEAAQDAALAFLERLPDRFRVGLVTFGRKARTLSAPTTDREALRGALSSIETTYGTVLGDGMSRALEAAAPALERQEPTVLLVLSDGNDTGSEVAPEAAATSATEANVSIHSIVMGTEEGDPDRGKRGANMELLRTVAEATGGGFYTAATADALQSVYRNLGARVSRETEIREMTYAFVGAGAVFALISAGLAALWFRRFP